MRTPTSSQTDDRCLDADDGMWLGCVRCKKKGVVVVVCDGEVHQCNASSATEQTMLRHWLATEHRWWLESPPM
jgi:hypothetical protein